MVTTDLHIRWIPTCVLCCVDNVLYVYISTWCLRVVELCSDFFLLVAIRTSIGRQLRVMQGHNNVFQRHTQRLRMWERWRVEVRL